jgi:hypothetical protein
MTELLQNPYPPPTGLAAGIMIDQPRWKKTLIELIGHLGPGAGVEILFQERQYWRRNRVSEIPSEKHSVHPREPISNKFRCSSEYRLRFAQKSKEHQSS